MNELNWIGKAYPLCGACGEYHGTGPDWSPDCPANPYGWPYSNRCPCCNARAMVNGTCTACGVDQHQEQCPECGTWQNHHHFEQNGGSGCVTCTPRRAHEKMLQEEREQHEQHKQYQKSLRIAGAKIWKERT